MFRHRTPQTFRELHNDVADEAIADHHLRVVSHKRVGLDVADEVELTVAEKLRLLSTEYGQDGVVLSFFDPMKGLHQLEDHVIPALIKRADDAQDILEIWGDGTQTRSFLYVTDFVDGILTAAEHAPNSDPVNIGTHEEVTIGELAQHVINTVNPKLRLEFDTTKPRGQPRRAGNLDRADAIGFSAQVSLPDGLQRTFDWYRRTHE